MISSLVSSVLSPLTANSADAATRTAAQQLKDDSSRPATATVIAAKPVANRPIDPIVDQGGASVGTDYFHAAKHMLGRAFGDFHHDMKDALDGLGFGDGVAGEMTKAVMSQTKNALLWGVGFSVKLMTATVSQTNVSSGAVSASSFSVSARSVEVAVNQSTGVINVNADKVSIESHSRGVAGAEEPHLLDISDSEGAPATSLSSALQALEKPETLFEEEDGDSSVRTTRDSDDRVVTAAAVAVTTEEPAFKGVLPTIDTPTVITKPEYRARIMVSSMEHSRNEKGELVTRLRLDTILPLSEVARKSTETAAA